jgi:thioredoxin reductase (NADPH)
MMSYDILIVGGGPAGMAAGLYSGRGQLKTVILERGAPGGQLLNTDRIDNYPGFDSITGVELAKLMADQVGKYAEFITSKVTEIYSEGDRHYAVSENGQTYQAGALVIAAGGESRKLGVPGEEEFRGKGVSYCAVCDGFFYKDREIAVIGGGDAAVEEALYLTKFGSKVTIVHRRDELRARKDLQEKAFAHTKIDFVWDSVVEEITGDDELRELRLRNVKTGKTTVRPAEGLFIFIGFNPNSNILRQPLKTDDQGHILTGTSMETEKSGIYAIGDVRSQLVRQVTNAVSDGTVAAIAAGKYLESKGLVKSG